MSTPTEEGLTESPDQPDQAEKPVNAEKKTLLEAVEDKVIEAIKEVDPKVLADQPQPQPPQPEPKKSRFTIICVCKISLEGATDPEVRDVAAVHVMGSSIADAKAAARTLLAAHVKETTLNDWDAVLTYLGHQEILNG